MELLLQSEIMSELPIGLTEIISPIQLQSREMRKLDKVLTSSEMLTCTSTIIDSSNTVCDVIENYYRQVSNFFLNFKLSYPICYPHHGNIF